MNDKKPLYIERKILDYFKERIGDKYKKEIKEREKNLEVSICKMTEEDHIEHGCDPGSTQDFGEVLNYTNQSIEDVHKIIGAFSSDNNKPCVYEDRIEISVTENADGHEPSAEERAKFEKGEIKLWVADYSFYVCKVERTPFEQSDLLDVFDLEISS